MDDHQLLENLETLATRLGIEVRREPADGRCGLCSLRGRRLAILDCDITTREQVDALAALLAAEDHEAVFLPPAVRDLLEAARDRPEAGGRS